MSELLNEELPFAEEIPVTEEEAGWQVDSDQAAEWCLRKIREAKAEKEKWTDFYMAQLKKVCDREEARIAFFEEKLKAYFEAVPHKVTKTQESYPLPTGRLILKEQKPEWTHDDSTLLPWVKVNAPELVKTQESVDWAALKKDLMMLDLSDEEEAPRIRVCNSDGLIVPGVTVTERPDKFVVEVK
jgi:hypothetical protein